ncbi:MAG: type II secretion system F family protein [Oligoflexia bacterium]|nr:type II secretion system F family protein [Oligoflexia bacterium]
MLITGTVLSGYAVYLIVSSVLASLGQTQEIQLSWASGEAPQKSKSGVIRLTRPLLHRLIPFTNRFQLTEYKEKIKRNIQAAGLAAELNENEYVALQVALGFIFPIMITVLNLLFNLGYPWIMVLFFAVFGFMYPYLYVKGEKDTRKTQVLIDLPFVVDLLALSTEAGLDFIGAIGKVVDKMTGGPLAEELGQVLRDLKLGSSRAEALNALAWRLNMSEVSSFIAVLVTADSLGASIGTVLRQQSEQMRQERFTKAEKMGAQASQKIFLPLVLFILPAVLLVVFGPVILQFIGS